MCFCKPTIRTPFCPDCNTAMFLRIKELTEERDVLLNTQCDFEQRTHCDGTSDYRCGSNHNMTLLKFFRSEVDSLKAERDALKTLLAESEEDNVRIRSTWTPPEKEFIPYKARGYEVFSDGSVSIGTVKKEKE